MTEAWTFRNGTLDEAIFHQVVRVNEYRLPERFAPGDIIIDVGSHIGSFAQAVLSRGCRSLYCIEPDRSNFEIAAANLQPYVDGGCVQLVRGAAWRSDRNTDQLYFDGYHPFPKSFMGMQGVVNTGNGSVIWGAANPSPRSPLTNRRPHDWAWRERGATAQAGLRGRGMADSADLAQAAPDPGNLWRVSRDRRKIFRDQRGSPGDDAGVLARADRAIHG